MNAKTLVTRRTLLQGTAALGASALMAGSVAGAPAPAFAESAGSNAGVQYGFLTDMTRCVGCELCVDACRAGNQLGDDASDRRRVSAYLDKYGMNAYVSTSCMHCAEPSCAAVCPAGAISKGEGGVVSVDKERCIGCKYCFQACPYEVPRYDSVAMDKCDCCLGAEVAVGEIPYCVQACKFDALRYGPLDQLAVEAGGAAVPIAEANGPSCLVLGERR
ncbi:4Fe-4S dicluster domain-containing protein [Arabiibacter massiliensis]|uniref:4Fe-4S dicluster domain-containing protein n=1 Tax=Arabiibacter massiliensis TaxID=1870985 RepID=UPI0009BA5D4F|nr:4Fe-4S dicluster domain-containing protein [Arabiibacter massiliensis]